MEEIDRRQKLLEETDETKNSMMFDSGNLSSADPKSLGKPNLRPKVCLLSVFNPKTLMVETEYYSKAKAKKSK